MSSNNLESVVSTPVLKYYNLLTELQKLKKENEQLKLQNEQLEISGILKIIPPYYARPLNDLVRIITYYSILLIILFIMWSLMWGLTWILMYMSSVVKDVLFSMGTCSNFYGEITIRDLIKK